MELRTYVAIPKEGAASLGKLPKRDHVRFDCLLVGGYCQIDMQTYLDIGHDADSRIHSLMRRRGAMELGVPVSYVRLRLKAAVPSPAVSFPISSLIATLKGNQENLKWHCRTGQQTPLQNPWVLVCQGHVVLVGECGVGEAYCYARNFLDDSFKPVLLTPFPFPTWSPT